MVHLDSAVSRAPPAPLEHLRFQANQANPANQDIRESVLQVTPDTPGVMGPLPLQVTPVNQATQEPAVGPGPMASPAKAANPVIQAQANPDIPDTRVEMAPRRVPDIQVTRERKATRVILERLAIQDFRDSPDSLEPPEHQVGLGSLAKAATVGNQEIRDCQAIPDGLESPVNPLIQDNQVTAVKAVTREHRAPLASRAGLASRESAVNLPILEFQVGRESQVIRDSLVTADRAVCPGLLGSRGSQVKVVSLRSPDNQAGRASVLTRVSRDTVAKAVTRACLVFQDGLEFQVFRDNPAGLAFPEFRAGRAKVVTPGPVVCLVSRVCPVPAEHRVSADSLVCLGFRA